MTVEGWFLVTTGRLRARVGVLVVLGTAACTTVTEPIFADDDDSSTSVPGGLDELDGLDDLDGEDDGESNGTTSSDDDTSTETSSSTVTGSQTSAGGSGSENSSGSDSPPSCMLPQSPAWSSSAPVIVAQPDATHDASSVKDPTAVWFDGRWHAFATSIASDGSFDLVYFTVDDWGQSPSKHQYLSANPGFTSYRAAPQVFYFRPRGLWYLIHHSPTPRWSTSTTIDDPLSWTVPEPFFDVMPENVATWVDPSVICDSTDCYLFFTDHEGNAFRSSTTVADFPQGMSEPEIILSDDRLLLFEGIAVYHLERVDRYLALIVGLGGLTGSRYNRAYVADRLDGEWTEFSGEYEDPFAGLTNVAFEGDPWATEIAQGELLRRDVDETMPVDPCDLQMLYHATIVDNPAHAVGLLTLDDPGSG